MSALVTFVSLNDEFTSYVAVKIHLPMGIKLTHSISNAISMLSSSLLVSKCLIILRNFFLIIDKRTAFVLKKDCLPTLIKKLSDSPSNCCKSIL